METMSFRLFIAASLLTGIIGALAGCGGDIGNKSVVVSSSASKECVSCHANNSKSISTASGVRITEQWQLSAHNSAHGAGCLDCHSYAHYYSIKMPCRDCHVAAHTDKGTLCNDCHNGKSTYLADCLTCHAKPHNNPAIPFDAALMNPDFAGKCLNCHNNRNNFKNLSVAARHFNNFTGAANHPAMYVTTNYQKSCTACHEPHNPLKGLGKTERKAWALSGHGDVKGLAWAEEDFSGSVSCIRCHTSTGFINYVESNFTLPRTTWALPGDKGREVLTCKACHLRSNFKASVRPTPPFTAPYGIVSFVPKAPVAYPNVGESNLCIPCHSGRENGTSIKKVISDFTNASFKNPHYLAAAAVFYGLGGFQFYSSASQTPYYAQAYTSKYGVVVDGTIIRAAAASTSNSTPAIAVGDVLTGEKAPWSHGKIGMNNFQTTKTAAVVAEKGTFVYTGTGGQCVACHLGSGALPGLHSLDAFEVARSTWTTSYKGCYGCHTNEDMDEVAKEERLLVDRALAFFKWQLLQVGAEYSSNHPYFYQPGTTNAVKNWVALTVPGGNGATSMGAAMNFKLLEAEKGVHVHNRTFMKQLLFDSLQYLQTGNVTFSNRYIATNSKADPNSLISFAAYSTALAAAPDNIRNPATYAASTGGVPGQPISITQLKAYVTRKNTGSNGAIGSSTAPLYTRP